MFSFKQLQPKHPENRDYQGSKTKALAQEVHQSLLSFPPDFTILIDVGWDPALSMDISYLLEAVSSIDVILLTHATIAHLGAYAYLCKVSSEFSSIPVYSTLPIINMGRMITLDAYRSKGLLGPLAAEKVTLADVEAAFDKVIALKYSQTISLDTSNNVRGVGDRNKRDSGNDGSATALPTPMSNLNTIGSIQITPFNAGHTLGGTIWKISKDQEVIIYAVDWNHSRDSHLNGAFLQPDAQLVDALSKPSLMICGTKISQLSSTLKKRKESLFRNIRDTIEAGGTVLLPTSTGARVLELVHILNAYWEKQNISTPLIYFSHVGQRTMSYASSMLEWMSAQVITEWQVQNKSPFDLKNLRIMSSIDELTKLDGPKVILASGEAMEVGFSRQLFAKLCSHNSSMVILTERCGPETLAGQLFDIWMKNKIESDDPNSCSKYLPFQMTTQMKLDIEKETPLAGDELVEYQDEIREKKQKLEIQSAIELRNKNILEQEDNEMSDDDDDEEEDEMVMSGQMDIGILLYGKDVYDYDVRTMPRGKPKILPFAAKRRRIDDYGEILRPDQFSQQAERLAAEQALISSGSEANENAKSESTITSAVQYNDETFRLDPFSDLAIPQKIVSKFESLKVLCYVDFIDFDGIADWRSLKMILELVSPRQLIFLSSCLDIKTIDAKNTSSGPSRNNRALIPADDIEEPTNVDRVVGEFEQQTEMKLELIEKALVNEAITTQIGSNTYSVIISPELEKQLRWKNIIGDYSVAHVTGKLEVSMAPVEGPVQEKLQNKGLEKEEGAATKGDDSKVVTTNTDDTSENKKQVIRTMIRLVPLKTPADFAAAPRFSPSVVGDIRLAELKKRLVNKGHKAEFKAEGILVCDDTVAVRKMSQGNLVIEGGTSPEFYKVRAVVRSLLAFV